MNEENNLKIDEIFALAYQNHQNNNFKAAENLYSKILKINSAHFKSIFFLGTLYAQIKKFDSSKQLLQKAVKIQPNNIDALNNLGNVLKELGESKNAMNCYQRAIKINPNYVDAHNNLGTIFVELREYEKAIESYGKAISINPKNAISHYNLGTAFKKLNEFKKSMNCYEKAIENDPNYVDAYNNLGIVFIELEEYRKAINCYQKAITIRPNHPDLYYNLGTIHEKFNEFSKSIDYYQKAINIKPDYLDAHNNLLFNICWSNNEDNNIYLEFIKKYYDSIPKYNVNKFTRLKLSNEKNLKVGFVSGDFRNHSVSHFLLDTLKNLRKKNLKLFAYSNNDVEDELTKLLKKYFDKWILITHKTEKDLIDLIRKDDIDILFDLSGHTKNNRLPIFRNRCAEVQVTWSGWLASTGVKEIDYIIGDVNSTPLSDQWKFTEKIYQLNKIWQCLSTSNLNSEIFSVKKNNKKFITFGSFSNTLKMNENVLTTWSKILNKVPESKLFLKSGSFDILQVRENFLKKFSNNGINQNRLIIEGASTRSQYLECYNQVDIILDTFPASGGTTSFEAAYMGVPVLTKVCDKSFWFRSGECVNKNLNMYDWIAKNEDDYIEKAIKFSKSKNHLVSLKSELRNIAFKSSLFDTENFSNDFHEMLLNITKR